MGLIPTEASRSIQNALKTLSSIDISLGKINDNLDRIASCLERFEDVDATSQLTEDGIIITSVEE